LDLSKEFKPALPTIVVANHIPEHVIVCDAVRQPGVDE
jgi:hypothetical protein